MHNSNIIQFKYSLDKFVPNVPTYFFITIYFHLLRKWNSRSNVCNIATDTCCFDVMKLLLTAFLKRTIYMHIYTYTHFLLSMISCCNMIIVFCYATPISERRRNKFQRKCSYLEIQCTTCTRLFIWDRNLFFFSR